MPEASSGVLDRFRQGDLAAFEALFREHQRAVYGWILRVVRDPAAVPWFDWALLAGLLAFAALFPAAIPVFLYYL
jgi:hypothetical protein